MDCPDEGTLLCYAAGQLEGDELDRVDAHIDACRACAELVVHAAREPALPSGDSGLPSETGTRYGASSSKHSDRSADELPYEIGRYVVLGRLGQGGMGTVFAAYDPRLQRHVAIKLLRRDRAVDARRLQMEARSLAALAHPNVVTVFEAGMLEGSGTTYLVMELVDGVTLRHWCRSGLHDADAIVAAYVAAGRGLAAAHAAGLVHRDFKPDNVLVGREGNVRVTDFGLARPSVRAGVSETGDPGWSSAVLAHAEHLTETGTVTGTPAYMAPEQREGKDVDARADQFAFCVSLWEALAGARPRDGDRSDATVPAHVRRALRRGLELDPDRRWPDMNALLRELSRPRRRTVRAAVAGVLAAGVAATLSWLAWPEDPAAVDEAPATVTTTDPDAMLSPDRRARVEAVREELKRVRPLWESTQLDEALRLSGYLLDDARRLEHPPLVAEVGVERGWALYEASRFDEASTVLTEAHELAWADGLDALAAESASLLVAVRDHLDDVEGGLVWARRAESAVQRMPAAERPDALTLLASARAQLFETAGRMDDARAEAELALEIVEASRPDDDPLLVHKLKSLGNVLSESDPEAALGYYARALEIGRQAYGDDHPDVALLLLDIGALHEVRDEADVGLPYTERALAIFEASYGPDHHLVATALYNLGVTYEELDDPLAASVLFERAADAYAATLGPNHRRVALPTVLLAYLSYEAGDLATAEAHYQRALVLYEEGLGPQHLECTTPLSGLAEIAIDQGRGERAVEFAERALAIAVAGGETDLGGRRFRLARALDVAGREEEATRLAERAHAELLDPTEADEVAQWLDARNDVTPTASISAGVETPR